MPQHCLTAIVETIYQEMSVSREHQIYCPVPCRDIDQSPMRPYPIIAIRVSGVSNEDSVVVDANAVTMPDLVHCDELLK